ncbi:MAG: hypothetical protein H0W64_07530 [Gammaproteobacteria bacterium]|nr:hypothetical protein [Gammaproteobacteria bacterium]
MKQFFEGLLSARKTVNTADRNVMDKSSHVLSKTKTIQKKKYFLLLASKHRYPERDFTRLIDTSAFERTMLADKNC